MAFLFVFFFWDSYDSNVGAFHIVPEVISMYDKVHYKKKKIKQKKKKKKRI